MYAAPVKRRESDKVRDRRQGGSPVVEQIFLETCEFVLSEWLEIARSADTEVLTQNDTCMMKCRFKR